MRQGRAAISASLPFNLHVYYLFQFFFALQPGSGARCALSFCLLLCLSWVTTQSPSSQYLLPAILALVHPEVLISFSLISLCCHTNKKSFFFGKKSLSIKASRGDGDHVNFTPRTRDPAQQVAKLLTRTLFCPEEGGYYLQSKFSKHAAVKPSSWFFNRKKTDKQKKPLSILASH